MSSALCAPPDGGCTPPEQWNQQMCRCQPVVCDPHSCPTGQHFDTTECKCTPNEGVGAPCDEAADCWGVLNDLCMVCPSGVAKCEHWVCKQNKCETTICG
jgi:hypothetical protein